MGIVTNTQGRGVNMGQCQQNRRAVLIVEDDAELREFAARLLEDGELDTIECESAEAALATMLIRGRDVAMIFADIRLPGVMDGIDLAREVRLRWPFLPVILTSGHPPDDQLPPAVDFMPKPWQLLNLLVAAKQALACLGDRPPWNRRSYSTYRLIARAARRAGRRTRGDEAGIGESRFGSIATQAVEATPRCMSASPPSDHSVII